MVISALRVEIPTTAGAETLTQPDELELAAAFAAVVSYIDASDKESLLTDATRPASDTRGSGWRRAAHLEGVGGAPGVTPPGPCRLTPWQSFSFSKICLSLPIACLSLFLTAGSAHAQDSAIQLRELPADQQVEEPRPVAPTRTTTTTTQVVTQTPRAPKASTTNMYSRVAPAQGYPFVNGKKSTQGSAVSSLDARAAASIPFSAIPANVPSPKAAVTPDGWIVDADEDQSQLPAMLPYATGSSQKTFSYKINGQDYSNVGIESQTVRTSTVIRPGGAAVDPTIQALVQAANQLNPSFVGKKTVLKIGLAFGNTRLDLAAIDGAQIRDAGSGSTIATLTPSSRWDVVVQNAGRSSQLALVKKRAGDSQPAPNAQDNVASTAYGDNGRYKNVAFYPGAPASGNQTSIRLPLKFGYDGAIGSIGADQSQASSSGYIISPRPGDSNSLLAVNGRLYRGAIWLKPLPKQIAAGQYRAAAFDVINLIDIEDYLLSVVPSEMPSGWPLEALKAQAIAARSYAVANVGKHGRDGYDLKATIDDQVYSGVSTESDNSNVAVAETGGLVLKHQGRTITAFFHSTSGGSTEYSENVWSRALPYLRSVPDFDDASPHFSWTRTVSADDLERAVAQDVGRLLSLSVVSRTGSNRAQTILVQGSNGSKTISGEQLRRAFRLPSTLFNVGSETNTYIFAGRGYGHGLGMSQYGAKALAERGCNAAQILSYYYKDVTLDNATTTPSI